MKEQKIRDLFFALLNANNEHEVEKIIIRNEVLKDNNNWKPYGGNQNNFGTFENQQNHPIPVMYAEKTVDKNLVN